MRNRFLYGNSTCAFHGHCASRVERQHCCAPATIQPPNNRTLPGAHTSKPWRSGTTSPCKVLRTCCVSPNRIPSLDRSSSRRGASASSVWKSGAIASGYCLSRSYPGRVLWSGTMNSGSQTPCMATFRVLGTDRKRRPTSHGRCARGPRHPLKPASGHPGGWHVHQLDNVLERSIVRSMGETIHPHAGRDSMSACSR
jgi:hypothetical protein